MKRWIIALLMAGSLPGLAAQEGVVRTITGEELRGILIFATNGVLLQPPTGHAVQVSLADISELSVPEVPVKEDAEGPTNAPTAEGTPAISDRWNATVVGAESAGNVAEDRRDTVVTGGGAGLRGNADGAFFADRRLDLSGQVVAQLVSFDGTAAEAMAGLTLRDNAGESAAYAFVGQRAGVGLCFQYRQIAGGMTMRLTNATHSLPAWLRVSRQGGAVVAEVSGDGREWQTLGRANINLGQFVRAGMVVTSGAIESVATARFRHPIVGARGLGYLAASGYPRISLRGGSTLIAPIESGDESVLRLGGVFQGSLVSVLNVARIEFVPLTPDLQSRLEPDRSGVLMADGDFLEASLRGIETNQVTMNSLLLGFRQFAAGNEAAVVQLGSVNPGNATFQVRLQNGSEIHTDHLAMDPEHLRAESPLLGAVVLKVDAIQEIRRGTAEPPP